MKRAVAVRAKYYDGLEQELNIKLVELQKNGHDIIDVTLAGRASESSNDWVALIIYEDNQDT